MKTKTSKRSTLKRTLLLSPVLGLLFFSFSSFNEVEKAVNPEKNQHEENSVPWGVKLKSLKTNELKNNRTDELNKMQNVFNVRKGLLPTINDKVCDNCTMTMSRNELKSLKIATNKNRKITQFKIKFPKGEIVTIEGNTFNEEIKTKLYLLNYGEKLTLFGLKSKNKSLNSKITIALVRTRLQSNAHVYKVSKNVITQGQTPGNLHSISKSITKGKFKETHKNDSVASKISHFPLPVPAMHSKSRKSPIDHIISMSKRGADFYYNGSKITSDMAIELLKKNSKLNMNSQTNNGKSVVYLSEKGMTIINGEMVENNN